MACKNSKEDHEGPCYKHFAAKTTSSSVTAWTNQSDKFIVVIGCETFDSISQQAFATAMGSVVHDEIYTNETASFTAAAPTNVASTFNANIFSTRGLPRRMLIAPGFYFLVTGVASTGFQAVGCATLEDALAIL